MKIKFWEKNYFFKEQNINTSMNNLSQELLFFFYWLTYKLAVWLAQLKAKCVFSQARERYGNNLKIWRTVMLTWEPTPKLNYCIIPRLLLQTSVAMLLSDLKVYLKSEILLHMPMMCYIWSANYELRMFR